MQAYDRRKLSTTKNKITMVYCFDKLENTVYRNLAVQGARRISAMETRGVFWHLLNEYLGGD